MIKENIAERKEKIVYIITILCMFMIVYVPVAMSGNMYMFIDIGADTYCSYWPSFSYVQNWLTNMSFWDMSLGLGSAVITQLCYFLIDPFNVPILCFDSYNMYIGIFLSLILKYVVLSIISYKYVRMFRLSSNWIINNIASTCIVFSGWFVGWGQHYNYATMFVFFMLILYFFEVWLQQGRWLGFVISLAYLCMMTPYYGYMILLFLAAYYILRYLSITPKFSIKRFILHGLQTAGICLLGVGCSFVLFLPEVEEILGSPRVSGVLDLSIRLASQEEYRSVILRLLSNNILGINQNWVGYSNYYEAPFLYVGLLFVIIFPNLFLREKRKKIHIFCGVLCILAFVFMQNTALLFNMFSAIVYRWTFLFIPVFALAVGKALDNFYQGEVRSNLSKVAIIIWMIIDLAFLVYLYTNNLAISKESFYMIVVNAILFLMYEVTLYDTRKMGIWLLYLVTIIDLAWNAYVSVNWRSLIPISSRTEMDYFDETKEIVQQLRSADDSFYRIYKKYAYVDLNDSMFQHYAGERFYSSTLTDSYWNLQEVFDLRIKQSNEFRGFDDKQCLRDISCGKYMLTNEPREYYGYDLIGQRGDKYIYINNNSHCFGFLYDSIISTSDFYKLPQYEQQDIIYSAALVEDIDIDKLQKLNVVKASNDSNLEPISFDMKLMQDAIEIELDEPNSRPVVVELMAPEGMLETARGYLYSAETGEEYSPYDYVDVSLSSGARKFYTINALGIKKIKIQCSPKDISQISIYEKDMSAIEACVDQNNANSLNIEKLNNDYILGNIYSEKEAILFLPVIYNKNWHIYVNGIEKDVLRVNGGFTGVYLDIGQNEVVFRYEAKTYLYGIIVSVLCLAFSITLWSVKKWGLLKNKKININVD